MFNIVLYEPEIPQNTGNIVRTCKSTGSVLHLIEPMGFVFDDKKLKRAGLDYWRGMDIRFYSDFQDFRSKNPNANVWLTETTGKIYYHQADYKDGDFLIFGKETTGIPSSVQEQYSNRIVRIPMAKDNRSLNLSNTVALVLYEALRQNEFLELI